MEESHERTTGWKADLRPVTVLLVEDDLGDQKLIKKSLSSQRINNKIVITDTGEEALQFLSECKTGEADGGLPDLILLDLNMPGMGGKEFLRRIKEDPQLDTIPVVILTTSDAEQDILESYKLQCSGYIKKPVTLNEFQRVIGQLEEYWFVICKHASVGVC